MLPGAPVLPVTSRSAKLDSLENDYSVAVFHIIRLTKLQIFPLDWIYGSIRVMTEDDKYKVGTGIANCCVKV